MFRLAMGGCRVTELQTVVQSSFRNEAPIRLQVQACVLSVCGLLDLSSSECQTLVVDMSLGRGDHFFPQLKLTTPTFMVYHQFNHSAQQSQIPGVISSCHKMFFEK